MAALDAAFVSRSEARWHAAPTIGARQVDGPARKCRSGRPSSRRSARSSTPIAIEVDAIARARAAQPAWDALGGEARAEVLDARGCRSIARATNWSCCSRVKRARTAPMRSAKCARPSISAVTTQCSRAEHFSHPISLRSPTGESNELALHGRGVFACISPWNFPLAIHVGQIAAALAAGNAVIAKPAEQTPLIAQRVAQFLLAAGVPADVYALLPGARRNRRRGAGRRSAHRRRRVYRIDRGRRADRSRSLARRASWFR